MLSKKTNTSFENYVWDDSSPSTYITIPKIHGTLFGRYIKSVRNDKIVCADFPLSMMIDAIPNVNNYEMKIKLFENAHIMRIYYNFFEKKWIIATSNRLNSKTSIYQTNKNLNIKWNNKSFHDLFLKYNKNFNFKKLSRHFTHIYAFFIPEIFITSRVKTPGIEYIAKINNQTLEITNFTDKISREKNGYIFIKGNKSFVWRDHIYQEKMEVMGNINNVHYIAVKNINNEKNFKRLFPYWSNVYNNMITFLHGMSVKLLRFYKLIHMSNGPKKKKKLIDYMKKNKIKMPYGKRGIFDYINKIKQRNQIFSIYAMAIHEFYNLYKIRITEIEVFKIICAQPSHLIASIYRKASI
jgi:hypothetical protein